MYKLRDEVSDRTASASGLHHETGEVGINPSPRSSLHTQVMNTEGLKQALDHYGFAAAFGGARPRRREEPRQGAHLLLPLRRPRWDPRNQRQSCGPLQQANLKGETIRVFPSVQLDRARYLGIHLTREPPDRPLYLAAERPV